MAQKNLGLLLLAILLILIGIGQTTGLAIFTEQVGRVVQGVLAIASGVCLLMAK